MFTRMENGAEVEIAISEKPINGAIEEIEGGYRIVDGAEEEVWSNIKVLDLIGKNVSSGYVKSQSEWGEKTNMATSTRDGGHVTYAASGTFTNPTLSCNYEGWMSYMTSSGTEYLYAGDLYAYGVKEDGTIVKDLIVDDVNTIDSGEQSISYTFDEGKYVKIGFVFQWMNRGYGEEYYPRNSFLISNILIDSRKCITDPTDDFDYGDVL